MCVPRLRSGEKLVFLLYANATMFGQTTSSYQVSFASAIDGHAPATSRPGKYLIYILFTTINRISKYP